MKANKLFILCLLLIVSLLALYYKNNISVSNQQSQVELTEKLTMALLESVRTGEMNKAIKIASIIYESTPNYKLSQKNIPHPIYVKLCKRSKVNPKYLTNDFNILDFQYWRDSLFFYDLARKITVDKNSDNDKIQALFDEVSNKIKPTALPKGHILWPTVIWDLKKGLCDRQAWVLCELAYQLGFETQIVYLREPKTLISPHTICEIRKGQKTWIVDPFAGELLEEVSVSDFKKDSKLAISTWSNKKWGDAISNAGLLLPAYPQDYCHRNQVLSSVVARYTMNKSFRFGENPKDRLEKYLELTDDEGKKYPYQFWDYPFRLLKDQITIINSINNK